MKKIILIIFVLFVVWIIAFNIKIRRDEEALRVLNNSQNTQNQITDYKNTEVKIQDTTDTVKDTTNSETTNKYTTGNGTRTPGPDGLKSGDVVIPNGFAPGPCPDKAMC